jgi:hypothetical protein
MIDLYPEALLIEYIRNHFDFSITDFGNIQSGNPPDEFYEEGQEIHITNLPSTPLKKYTWQTSTFHSRGSQLRFWIRLITEAQSALSYITYRIVDDFLKMETRNALAISCPMECEGEQILVEKDDIWIRLTLKQKRWDYAIIVETLIALVPCEQG